MDDLIRITPDKERAKGLLRLIRLRYDRLDTYDIEKESQLIVE